MAEHSDDDGCFEKEGAFGTDPEDSGEEECDPTDGMKDYEEPTIPLSCFIPVNEEEQCSGFDPSGYDATVDPNKKILMACGCAAFLGDILTEETKICNTHKSFNQQQPEEDVLLTLFCGKCRKQITVPSSAWIICRYHGFANLILQDSTENFD
jgi:hypothetical protein